MGVPIKTLRLTRLASVLVVAAAAAATSSLAFTGATTTLTSAGGGHPRHASATSGPGASASPRSAAGAATPATPGSAAALGNALVGTAAPVAGTNSGAPVLAAAASANPGNSTTPTIPPPATNPTPMPTPTPDELPACPLGLAAPANPGGLQSLIGFAPFFGPVSSEAFAAAPLFQPLLQAIGPFLVAMANAYAPYAPSLAPLVNALEAAENQGFNVLAPLYGPYRNQFLSSEAALATALAPIVEAGVSNAATSCLVDIEAALAP